MCILGSIPCAKMAEAHLEECLVNSKSIVWNYFGLKVNEFGIALPEEEERPICRTCKKAVPAKGGNTSNLLTYLRDHHPDLHAEAIPHCSHTTKATRHQPTLHDVVDKTRKYDPKSSRAQVLNKAVAYYIAKDMQSLYTVEKTWV